MLRETEERSDRPHVVDISESIDRKSSEEELSSDETSITDTSVESSEEDLDGLESRMSSRVWVRMCSWRSRASMWWSGLAKASLMRGIMVKSSICCGVQDCGVEWLGT